MNSKKISKQERERITKLQEELKKIPPPSKKEIQHMIEVSREMSKISVEKLYRPFDI